MERREEGLFHSVADPLNPQEDTIPQSYSRHIESLYSQLVLPLVGDAANPRAAPRLELNVAGRYEHYSDFGGTFNPTFPHSMDSDPTPEAAGKLGTILPCPDAR